mmetsp:Transcript_23574/g.60252  ORF Transcript_23574/g.60252 Transcript_23574/m.60252 type:complete len:644 (+) Transcript_23574:1017-2948(+)
MRLPLSTFGRFIVDADGSRVKLACVNWYGAHMRQFVVGGLHRRNIHELADTIRNMGFNCVRLPVSIELVQNNPPVCDEALAANPALQGASALTLLDAVVAALGRLSIMTILNVHNSAAGWCCEPGSPEGLWWTDAWPAHAWLDALAHLALRYRNTSHMVVGMDLRNEIHDAPALRRIVRYGDGSGDSTLSSDWRAAAEAGGRAVLRSNPEWLVIVGGLCSGFDLRLIAASESSLPQLPSGHQHKLVLSTHCYPTARWWLVVEQRLLAPLTFKSVHESTTLPLLAMICVLVACGVVVCSLMMCAFRGDGAQHLDALVHQDGAVEMARREHFASSYEFDPTGVGYGDEDGRHTTTSGSGMPSPSRGKAAAWRSRCFKTRWTVVTGLLAALGLLLVITSVTASTAAALFTEGYQRAGCHELDRLEPARLNTLAIGCGIGCLVVVTSIVLMLCGAKTGRAGASIRRRPTFWLQAHCPCSRLATVRSGAVLHCCVGASACTCTTALVAALLLLYAHSLVGHFASPIAALEADLRSKWRLDTLQVPLWVGEWAPWADPSEGFADDFAAVLRMHDLDWSVWSLNGDAWVDNTTWRNWSAYPRYDAPAFGTSGYRNEDSGLLDRDWRGVRDTAGLARLQALQRPVRVQPWP